MRVVSQSLQLRIQRRRRRLVALETTERDVDHAFFKVRDFNATRIVLERHLIADTAHIVVCEGGMEILIY